MTVPPGNGGPPQGPDPRYPQGDQPYQYSSPEPPPKRRNTKAIVTLIVVIAVLLLAAIAAIVLAGRADDSGDATIEDATSSPETTETEPETTGPPSIEESVGRCLPFEPQLTENAIDLSTPCESDQAFWTVTTAAEAVGAAVDGEGNLTDVEPALEVCGDEWGSYRPGRTWTDWYYTYDTLSSQVEELYCVEAVGNTDADGREPVTPEVDDCFDDSERWWTVPCDSDLAQYIVTDTIEIDPPAELSGDDADEAAEPCESGELYWQLVDVRGRTTDILCGDER